MLFQQRLLGRYASQHRARDAYRWSVDVTVYIDPALHGKEIDRALCQRLLPRMEKQGFHAAYAGIALPNAGSIGIHKVALPISVRITRLGTNTANGIAWVIGANHFVR